MPGDAPALAQVRLKAIDRPEIAVGCGLLITPRHLVTCAHLVADACGDRALALADHAPDGSSKRRYRDSFLDSGGWDKTGRWLTAYTVSH